MVVKVRTLENILKCFANEDEFEEFYTAMHLMIQEISFTNQLAARSLSDEETYKTLVVKEIFLLGVFVKEHIEQLRDIINKVEFSEVSAADKKKLEDDPETRNIDRLT